MTPPPLTLSGRIDPPLLPLPSAAFFFFLLLPRCSFFAARPAAASSSPPRPCAKVAMSHRAESSSASRSGRRQERGCSSTRVHAVAYPTGKESGLPLIECPDCGLARVIELRAKKDTVNNGRTFFKCPRNGVSFSIPLC